MLAILGNLSRTFQLAQLNLLVVEQLVTHTKAALRVIKDNPLQGAYMMELDTTIQSIGITTALDKDSFIKNAKSYIEAIIANLENRFPEVRTLTLLGYFGPRNVIQQSTTGATPLTMLEVGEKLHVDGHKLWQEYIGYKSFVESLPRPLYAWTQLFMSCIHQQTRRQWQLLTPSYLGFWHE